MDIFFDKISNEINNLNGLYSSYRLAEHFYKNNLVNDIWETENLLWASFCKIYEIEIEILDYPIKNPDTIARINFDKIIKDWAKDDYIYKYNELKLLKAQKAISDNSMSNKMNFIIKNVDLNSELGKLIINIINENKSIENKYVYLIYDVNGNSYKFGQTYDLIYREKTLRAKEPKIELIKFCQTNVITESDLKEKYKSPTKNK